MKRHLLTTADGSTTLRIEDWDEPYHSVHGAIQESRHVFIKEGLRHIGHGPISVLEMGFGTGLNALLTLLEADILQHPISYEGVEAFPLTLAEVAQLNYIEQLGIPDYKAAFELMHSCAWEEWKSLSPFFTLFKRRCDFLQLRPVGTYDLIYYDAFGARVQPELWTETQFEKMYAMLGAGGILVTYAAKGSIRRAMQAVGFIVERLPGPPGKREMLRASKPPL